MTKKYTPFRELSKNIDHGIRSFGNIAVDMNDAYLGFFTQNRDKGIII